VEIINKRRSKHSRQLFCSSWWDGTEQECHISLIAAGKEKEIAAALKNN